MEIDKTIENLVAELESSEDKKLEYWKSLKEDLKKRRLSEYEQYTEGISLDEAEKLLPIMKKLEERFGYGRMLSSIKTTGGSSVQFERILEFSKIKGDLCGMMDVIADAGYTLNWYKDDGTVIKYLTEKDVALFKRLMKNDTYKKFYGIFKTLKTVLGYENKTYSANYHTEMENLIELTKIKGDAVGAICLLAEKGYRIREEIGLTEKYVETIEYVTRNILKKSETDMLCMYNKLKPELFKEYFTSVSLGKKKKILEKMLELDHPDEGIISWLDNSYPDLMREVSFED